MGINLTQEEETKVIDEATSYLGASYKNPGFTCVDYVRATYRKIGIELPLLAPTSPPREFNLTEDQLRDPPIGHLFFLKKKNTKRNREWTHVAIALPKRRCIHCSRSQGKVVVSSLEEVFEKYHFAPSL